jgi:hypothetical protein
MLCRLFHPSTTPDSSLERAIQAIHLREHTTYTTRLVSSQLKPRVMKLFSNLNPQTYTASLYTGHSSSTLLRLHCAGRLLSWSGVYQSAVRRSCLSPWFLRLYSPERSLRLWGRLLWVCDGMFTLLARGTDVCEGYVLAAIYSVGYFSMSTWVPSTSPSGIRH